MIREELPQDFAAVREVNELAFGGPAEADLVEALRSLPKSLSLVAVEEARPVGHVLFTRAMIEMEEGTVAVMALGPMAVRPDRQRRGVGSDLVRAGLKECRKRGADGIVVVGHPSYYPRFGFRPAADLGLRCEWPVPREVFMALELSPGALASKPGLVRYHAAFHSV